MIWAIVKFQFEGYHQWKDALEECKFLQNLHRHIFYCEVWVSQKHNERDIEYITFKNWLLDLIPSPQFQWVNLQQKFGISETDSCETMGTKIKGFIMEFYPNRKVKVKVMEDDENGAFVE